MRANKSQFAAALSQPALTPEFVAALLSNRQYPQLIELLQRAQGAVPVGGDDVGAAALRAACQVCFACNLLNETAAWHQRAADEAEQQTQELEQLLQALVALVYADPPAALTTQVMTGRGSSLWQRFQQILLRRDALLHPVCLPEYEPSDGYALPTNGHLTAAPPPTPFPTAPDHETSRAAALPALVVYGLGTFRVYLGSQPVKNWLNRKSKALFKYLLWHGKRPVAKEVLMDLFWPDTPEQAARNNLNVTIYNLRQTLRQSDAGCSYILFQDDSYLLNPDLNSWIDFEAFMSFYEQGQSLEASGQAAQAAQAYQAAELLYQGELYEEDRYEDWIAPHRQALHNCYLTSLDYLSRRAFAQQNYAVCIALDSKHLWSDPCSEETHRRLMRCYMAQGQHYLAIRQYHRCVELLEAHLEIAPSPETVNLYEQIRAAF